MSKRALLCAIVSLLLPLAAQESGKAFQKAPLGVEEALKARVMEFFDMQQAGKFRQAEALVCEDTKDHYYNMDKQGHKGSQFVKIFFDDGFKSAKAQVNLDIEMNTITGPMPVKYPMMSYWRLDGANWCYYIPQRNKDYYETPFGMMKRDPNSKGATPPPAVQVDIAKLRSAVRISRDQVRFSIYRASKMELFLVNTLPGEVEVRMEVPPIPGLTIGLEKTKLLGNERAMVTIEYEPQAEKKPVPPVSVRFVVLPFNQRIDLKVLFDNAPPG